jgi:hypothetical protein
LEQRSETLQSELRALRREYELEKLKWREFAQIDLHEYRRQQQEVVLYAG